MTADPKKPGRVGLVAGYGQFPVLFSRAASRRGLEVHALGLEGQDIDPGLAGCVAGLDREHLGELERIIGHFKALGITDVVFLGGIDKARLFADLRLDALAEKILASLTSTLDDEILSTFATVLAEHGITVRASTWLLPELLAPAGCWTKREPTDQEASDIALGHRLAQKIGELDIGQCIVVGRGSVLAVEAIDGTDATIRRGGSLGNGCAVVVKVCKPGQDQRFDLPASGLSTVTTMAEAGATALAVDAGRSVVFDYDEMVAFADEHGMAIVGLPPATQTEDTP